MIEEKDYKEIGTKLPIQIFEKEIAKIMSKFQKQYKPYDEPCARLDFKDIVESAEKESERKHGYIKMNEVKIDLSEFDFDKYADPDRFILEEDQEDTAEKFIQGTRTRVILGHTLSYRCKQRGHGIAVFVPMADYKDVVEGKFVKKAARKEEIVDMISDRK